MNRARTFAIVLMLTGQPALALAEPDSCAPERLAAADASRADEARMRCDIDRASEIRFQAERLHGPGPAARLEIIDTKSPSGSAYVYAVFDEDAWTFLEARSVPTRSETGTLPACSLRTGMPADISGELNRTLADVTAADLPAYGSREEITFNPDGSRSVRLVLDSHDVITRISTGEGPRFFSRHAGSADAITRLNNLVIGVANLSSGWNCAAS